MRFGDPDLVRREYASEERLLARRAVFTDLVEGPDAEELALRAVREMEPEQVLEVGCGPGYFAERLRDELGADVVAADNHVQDLHRALDEIVRVLRRGGRLVAATFGDDHLRELWAWLEYEKAAAVEFSRENGAEALRRHFARVERRDADAVVVFPDREAVRRYVAATIRGSHLAGALPPWEGEFRARSSQAVFVAETAA